MNGWISLHRSITEHWIFKDERMFRRWILILLYVNHCPTKFNVGYEIFVCPAGSSFRSLAEWAALFETDKKHVIKFFDLLEKEGMISRQIKGKGNRRKHLLTVTNWNKYQKTDTETATETATEIATEKHPLTIIKNNDNNENNNSDRPSVKTEKKEKTPTYDFSIVPEALVPAVKLWIEYKAESKHKYKSIGFARMVKRLCEYSGGNGDVAMEIIETSISNGWSGFFKPKNEPKKTSEKAQHLNDKEKWDNTEKNYQKI